MSALRYAVPALVMAAEFGLCDIPVFRYALERWPAAPYEAVMFHKGPLDVAAEDAARQINETSANLIVERIDVSGKLEKERLDIWRAQGDPPLPWMVLRFPMSEPGMPTAWAGRPDAASVRALVDSPARREIVRRLIRGESAVWVLIECGDDSKDAAAASLLETELESLEKTLKLPVEDMSELPLMTEVPLKIDFSVLRISRRDPAEREFVGMLARLGGELKEGKGPVALPVFGRGRALWAVSGEGLSPQGIAEAAEFLAGACSCQVKELNPGLDLLIDADWERLLSDASGVESGEERPVARPAPQRPDDAAPVPRTGPRWKWLWAVAAAAAVALVVGLIVLRRPAGSC